MDKFIKYFIIVIGWIITVTFALIGVGCIATGEFIIGSLLLFGFGSCAYSLWTYKDLTREEKKRLDERGNRVGEAFEKGMIKAFAGLGNWFGGLQGKNQVWVVVIVLIVGFNVFDNDQPVRAETAQAKSKPVKLGTPYDYATRGQTVCTSYGAAKLAAKAGNMPHGCTTIDQDVKIQVIDVHSEGWGSQIIEVATERSRLYIVGTFETRYE